MLSRQLPLWLAVLVLIVSAPCAQASKGQVTADRYVGNEAEIGIVTINQTGLYTDEAEIGSATINQTGLNVDTIEVTQSFNLTADKKIYFGDTFSLYYDSANDRLVIRSEPDDADLIYINVLSTIEDRIAEFPTPVRLNDGVALYFGTGEDFYIKYNPYTNSLVIRNYSTREGVEVDSLGNITPVHDNVSAIGSPSLRYNAIYSYAVYTGDLKFANGWVLTEAENLGLGRGIVLVSPDGEVYGVGDLKYCNKGVPLTHAVTCAVTGLLAGLGIGAGAAVVNKKLRK